VIPLAKNNATTGGILTVQEAMNHTLGSAVGLVLIWFFMTATVVYNYSFARLLFVSGLERRMPPVMGHVNSRTKVPDAAVIAQSTIASVLALVLFLRPSAPSALATKIYLALLSAIITVWCMSMVLLFLDIFFVRRWFPERFEQVRLVPRWLLNTAGVVGLLASAFGGLVVFDKFFAPAGLFTLSEWRLRVGALTGGSVLIGLVIFAISEVVRRRSLEAGAPVTEVDAAPAGGGGS